VKVAQLFAPSTDGASSKGSTIYDLGDLQLYAISVDFSGSNLAGTLKLKAGNESSNLVDVANSSQAITSGASHVWNVIGAGYRYIQVDWSYTSGAGTISSEIVAKETRVVGA